MKNLDLVVVAALLHDIGKFAQRARSQKDSSIRDSYCPINWRTKKHSHAHVLYTYPFITNHLKLPDELVGRRQDIAHLASCHHKPANLISEKALTRGDCLSAGLDRAQEERKRKYGNYLSTRMLSIFHQVAFRKKTIEGSIFDYPYYPLKEIGERPFATTLKDSRATRYKKIFDSFVNDVNKLPQNMGTRHYVSSLMSLLEKHTWCIPSSTWGTVPDISLYDHAVTTAAIAQALYVFHENVGGFPGEDKDKKKFILFGGDLSGIQDYIFDLEKSNSAGVAKIFRARSLYLQVIMRSVIATLLNHDQLDLFPVSRIVDAGGRFVLLLPATPTVRELLPKFDKEIQKWFFKTFRGEVSLVCSYATELSENDLVLKQFQKRLDVFLDSIEEAKTRKFNKIFGETKPIIELNYDLYENGACNVCRKEPADPDSMACFEKETGNSISICKVCYQQISFLGKKITDPSVKYIVLSYDEKNDSKEIPLFNGLFMRFVKAMDIGDASAVEIINIRSRDSYSFHPLAGYIPMIGSKDMKRWEEAGLLEETEGVKTYSGDIVKQDMPKTFQILAGESREVTKEEDGHTSISGKCFLAALKADVDNLGIIFSIGLGDNLSVSRFVGLSRMINFFFGEYLVSVIKTRFPDIYVIFSGGDDLFVLGPWPMLMEFASTAKEEFARFVSDNPDIGLSAGIAVVKPVFPVQAIAREAERLLELSKKNVTGQGSKNSVTMFDTTVSWDDFRKLYEEGNWFVDLIRKKKVSIGLIRRLLGYSEDFIAFTQKGKIRQGIYLSHMSYDFARNVNNNFDNNNDEENVKIQGMKQNHFLLEHMKLPVTIALNKTRS